MPSLNLDLNFFDHPKVKRLRALAGPEAEVYLLRLWSYAGRYHAVDGILKNFSGPEIETIIDWRGEKLAMLQAMLKVGFLEKARNGYKIHDWQEHEGHLIIFRERARLASAQRWGNRINKESLPLSNATSNATSNALAVHCSSLQSKALSTAPAKPGEGGGDDKKSVNWENCNTDLQRLVAHYVKIEMPELYHSATQSQSTGIFKRYGRAASEILAVAGNLDTAIKSFDSARMFFIQKNLSWNLSTVAKNIGEFVNEIIGEKTKK